MATLKVISGSDSGQSMEIDHEIVVGREGADVAIDDAEVSRRHAAIRPVDGGVEVEDLGSKNGTLLDGKRITGTLLLTSSGRVQIGGTEVRIEVPLAGPAVTRAHDRPVADPTVEPATTRARDIPVAGPQRTASAPARAAGPARTRVAQRPEGGAAAGGTPADERESAKAALILAVAGGLIGVIGSAAHPQPSPDELNVKAFLDTIVPSDSWVLLHLLILFSLFFGAGALVLLSRSLERGPGALLARMGALVLVAATAMGGVWMLLDGLAMKAIADDWAASTGAAHVADERAAIAIEHFILALFSAWLVFWQGVPYVCLGLACIQDGRFPKWAGAMGAAIGAASFVLGVIQFYTERDALITHTLMPPVSVLGGIWLPIIVFLWWRLVRDGPGGSREPGLAAGAPAV